jgi:glycosyltransferase involved in cell wall biosynthesis
VAPVLLTGTRPDKLMQQFAGFPVLRTPLLDRKSLPWAIRKAIAVVLRRDLLLERYLKRNGIAVLSHSGHLGPRSKVPTIGWIPDLQHLHLPGFFPARHIRDRNRGYSTLCNNCTRVVVSSQSSRADLEAFAPAARSKVDVLSFVAVPPVPDARHTLAEMQQTYRFDKPYFLLPNQFWAHKNHRVVIDALQQSKQKGCRALVLATGQTTDTRNPAYYSSLLAHAKQADVLDCFRVLGAVPSGHLALLMEHALAFINPSLFEGWSTSVEEAKSMGKQVLLSDIPVHREQAPARGIFFAPHDADALAAGLETVQRTYNPASEAALQAEATAQLPQRLQAFASQYTQIMTTALGSPRSPQTRRLPFLSRKYPTHKARV